MWYSVLEKVYIILRGILMADYKTEEDSLIIRTDSRIDTTNAEAVKADLHRICGDCAHESLVLDMEDTKYISSSGLRVILGLIKAEKDIKAVNVSPDVYDIMEMTGFTELFEVSKAFKHLSVEGCEVIGSGAKGIVYRYDPETVVKVYRDPDNLPEIQKERSLARKAFVLGIPTAISYEIVRVGESFGSVFELIDTKSFSQLISEEPENFELYTDRYANLLRKIHDTDVSPDDVPDIKPLIKKWLEGCRRFLADDVNEKLERLVDEAPDTLKMIHGDYHTNNLMMQNGETILIDMDTLARGIPVFELANVHGALVAFGKINPEKQEKFTHVPYDICVKMWERFLPVYFKTDDRKFLDECEKKIELFSYVRFLRHVGRREENPDTKKEVELCVEKITGLCSEVDDLNF